MNTYGRVPLRLRSGQAITRAVERSSTMFRHGLTRIDTDKNRSVKIRANPWLGFRFVSGHDFSRAETKFELPAFRPWGSKGVNELRFKIKDQDYFLAFVEQENRWYVFAPTPQGVHRIPVYVDAAKYEKPGALVTETLAS